MKQKQEYQANCSAEADVPQNYTNIHHSRYITPAFKERGCNSAHAAGTQGSSSHCPESVLSMHTYCLLMRPTPCDSNYMLACDAVASH
jgi:hypothetical protein